MMNQTASIGFREKADIKAVLLVGGMGTRLRSVLPSKPKALASVGSGSFLELLVRQLRNQGMRRLVLCTGYLAEQVEQEMGDGWAAGLAIEYSKEPSPLGTAGAVRLARRFLRDEPEFLAMNGDSFLEIDFRQLIDFHRSHAALASMAVRRVEDASRYGTVQVNADGRVIGFVEKTGKDSPGLINAGVYVFNQALFHHIPEGPSSLERDVFPRLLDRGMYALEEHGVFIDIGTPEDYARAQRISERLFEAASCGQQSRA